ncbi:ABSCISIC ACID-INSENSITIVE 5-like protein 2 [Oryza glaberrima]|uniref:BZIP domain-containing protein n=1 Tax=Oryza glaberrima TaxID=4538 RepID=I1Q5D3_ORYGL|nr:ABSCISIC ACID-INSENSITIVE 5-like protein 2 [Oryza glaberrima]XP_052158041.1 ABSCISIC ACID-INSENSITIVE 5-like protein 2 [Oryza glaberrima]
MANYHHQEYYQMAAAAAAAVAWPREPDSPQLSIMSGCSSLFSISTLRDDDDGGVRLAGAALPATPVSLAGIAGGASTPGGDEVDMEVRQQSGGSGDDRRTIRMMRNRESALRSRARKRAYVEELEKEVRRLVDDNLNLKKQCKELKQEVAALVMPTKSSLRRTSSTQF